MAVMTAKKIKYNELPPPPALQPYVKCFWNYENHTADTQQFTILPDGFFDYIAEIGNGKRAVISLTGLWQKPTTVTVESGLIQYAVRFKLQAAEYLLNKKISSLLNGHESPPTVLTELDPAVWPDFIGFTRSAARTLTKYLKISGPHDERKISLLNLLYETKGALTVDEYSRRAGWSSRQINRYFNEWYGLPLKAYCKTLRCYASFNDIKKGSLFPENNYYDQSHFIKEVKKHTGVNPRELLKNQDDRFLQFSTLEKD